MCIVNPPINNPNPHFEIPLPGDYGELEPMNVDSPMDKEGERKRRNLLKMVILFSIWKMSKKAMIMLHLTQLVEQIITSEASFHSIHNYRNSSSTMVREINEIDLGNLEMSTSNPSKRKNNEGMDDTASSVAVGGKKLGF
ncbi:hypothetical protein V2J09_024045 [Rumex salicifolius]